MRDASTSAANGNLSTVPWLWQELTRMGVSNIITFDAHDPRVQNAIPRSGFENVHPTYQMLKALLRKLPDLKIDRDHMMCISPDEGAANRNIYYATMLGLDMGLFYKRRDYSVVVNGRNPIVAHDTWANRSRARMCSLQTTSWPPGDSMLDLARELKRRQVRPHLHGDHVCDVHQRHRGVQPGL